MNVFCGHRAVGLLEGSARLQEALLAPLRRMTALQVPPIPALRTVVLRAQCAPLCCSFVIVCSMLPPSQNQ